MTPPPDRAPGPPAALPDALPRTLPNAPWRERAGFARLCAALDAREGAIRLVGGAVRDSLLGIAVHDIDLATRLAPDAVMQRLKTAGIKVVPTGLAHGTVTAILGGQPFEITTLRRDVSTDGRRATIAYTDDWREDAARRDFTINALYADPATGALFDYFGGLEDLAARRVRFIGDATRRIDEDHLRILRYFRFLARFGALPPDETAYSACIAQASSLMSLSRERIADEMLKLLALPDPTTVLELMIDGGIFAPVLPEITAAGLARLRALLPREGAIARPPVPLLRLAALLPPDAETGAAVASRLKLSNKARKRIGAALTPPPAAGSPQELAFRLGVEGAVDRILLDPTRPAAEAQAVLDWTIPDFPIGGRDLMALGLEPGPAIARALGAVRERWIAAGFPDRSAAQAIAEEWIGSLRRERQNS